MALARRHPADLARAGVGELRESLAPGHQRALDEARDSRPHRLGAEEQRLVQAAGVEQPVGEDVAAVGIAAELDLVDGEEVGADVDRHRLDRADPVGGARRHDPLLAGDERDDRGPAQRDDAVVDLAGEEPQRQADDAGPVREHALDGEMGLAGVRRAEDGRDPRAGSPSIAICSALRRGLRARLRPSSARAA